MKRDLHRMSDEEYDVLVIGGGIYGVSVAWDAVLRGLKVALIERGDFGGATSSNSLKIIHGGLRYLQSLDIRRMRQSIHERMLLMGTAPHLVFPMPVVMPTYGRGMKSRMAMFAALLANDIIGFDRNGLEDRDKYLPGGRLISARELGEQVPGYDTRRASGGALWYDCQCRNTERLVMSYLLSADLMGARCANYLGCTGFLLDGSKVKGVRVRDVLGGDFFDVKAKIVVNTSGPWIDSVIKNIRDDYASDRFICSSAMNIVVRKKLLNEVMAGLPGPHRYQRDDGSVYNGSRILFFVPWRGYTIIGTDHRPYYGGPDDYRAAEKEIKDFTDAVNEAYPAADITADDITFHHSGLLPMTGINPRTGEVRLVKSYRVHDHRDEDGIEGLISVLGVKYTTHRYVACRVVDMVLDKLGGKPRRCKTGETPVYGGDVGRFQDYLSGAVRESALDKDLTAHLVYTYGSQYRDVLKHAEEDPGLMQRVTGSGEVIRAEVVNGVRNEMALKLSDIVLRRTNLGTAEKPGIDTLTETAQIMGKELGWDRARISKEIEETDRAYMPASLRPFCCGAGN